MFYPIYIINNEAYLGAILSSFLLGSCSNTFYQHVNGTYDHRGKDFYYTLSMTDSSFSFTQRYFEVNSSCNGKWKKISNNRFLLICDDTDMSARLFSGYMSDRLRKVKVRSRDEIQIGDVILMRVK